ncbi:MAG: DNA mismatch repair endonuclease MutL [Phycisphaerales bacterium JB037]
MPGIRQQIEQQAAGRAGQAPRRRAIRKLEALLVNQIAAGEVIERPASVLKELVENALDAGAGRITVELEQGGIELVRVTDDGEGIPRDQLLLALEPHATSKVERAEDLDRIGTLGFRGEALASIASVSRLTIRSRVPGEPGAWRVSCEGGAFVAGPRSADRGQDAIRPASGPVGTMVEARNLFFNTPARRKFLRTPRTEQGRCTDWLKHLALARPALAFTLICDGRTLLDLPPLQGPRDRTLAILGRELEDQLLAVHLDAMHDDRGVTIWGLVGTPAIARATAAQQHVFVNGRLVRDKTIQHALREAYRGLIEPGRHPTAVMMIEMPPGAVDVNVHPAKLEVRFRDQSMIHGSVLRSVREALQRHDLTPAADRAVRSAFPADPGSRDAILPGSPGLADHAGPRGASAWSLREPGSGEQASLPIREAAQREPWRTDAIRAALAADLPRLLDNTRQSTALRVHNSYLIAEDEHGVLIIDQHALHERVMFEKLLARVNAGPLERQALLTPAVLDADEARLEALESCAPLLDRLGIAAEPIGPRSIGVRSVPTFLLERRVEPIEFVADLLDRVAGERLVPGEEEALHEVLDMMACKAAVKAGDALRPEEIDELLRLRAQVERSGSCPHGRPTSVRLSIADLEKLFHRR